MERYRLDTKRDGVCPNPSGTTKLGSCEIEGRSQNPLDASGMTVLVDDSVGIEVWRDTGSELGEAVDGLSSGELAICEILSRLVLGSARADLHLARLEVHPACVRMMDSTFGDNDRAAAL